MIQIQAYSRLALKIRNQSSQFLMKPEKPMGDSRKKSRPKDNRKVPQEPKEAIKLLERKPKLPANIIKVEEDKETGNPDARKGKKNEEEPKELPKQLSKKSGKLAQVQQRFKQRDSRIIANQSEVKIEEEKPNQFRKLTRLNNREKQFTQDPLQMEEKLEPMNEKDVWILIDKLMKKNGLVQTQIDSFNKNFIDALPEYINKEGHMVTFIEHQFESTIGTPTQITWQFQIHCGDLSHLRPVHINMDGTISKTFPQMCKVRDLNYQVELRVDVNFKKIVTQIMPNAPNRVIEDGQWQNIPNVFLGYLPVMVGSKWCRLNEATTPEQKINMDECIYNQGGYFIVNGSEKLIQAQERLAFNEFFIFNTKTDIEPLVAEIKSVSPIPGSIPQICRVVLRIERQIPRLYARIPCLKKPIPLFLLMRALGVASDMDITEWICESKIKDMQQLKDDSADILKKFLEVLTNSSDKMRVPNQTSALAYIGDQMNILDKKTPIKALQLTARNNIHEKVLPHIGTEDVHSRAKAHFLAGMAKQVMLRYFYKDKQSTRDHLGIKRIDLAGQLIMQLFTHGFKRAVLPNARLLLEKIKGQQNQREALIKKTPLMFDSRTITTKMRHALSTGNWSSPMNFDSARMGVAQTLKKDVNHFATLSYLRKCVAPIPFGSKIAQPRLLHNTHYGLICPSQTPEGEKIGLLKSLAFMSKVSENTDGGDLTKMFNILIQEGSLLAYNSQCSIDGLLNKTKVMLNGKWIAFTQDIQTVFQFLKRAKRSGKIHYQTSISQNRQKGQINIRTEGGRLIRPVLVVSDNEIILKKKHVQGEMTVEDYINRGMIQYVDALEEENMLIAMDASYLVKKERKEGIYILSEEYTHCEIHPSMMFGVCASFTPFANHNQATKATLQSAMAKQAIGITNTNHEMLFDNINYQLYYPQKPLITTKASKYLNVNQMPAGQNPIVAMEIFTGYNQEDSIILNKGALERGMFRTTTYRSYKTEEKVSALSGLKSVFYKPTIRDQGALAQDYLNKLDEDGLVHPGQIVDSDFNVLVCRKLEVNFKPGKFYLQAMAETSPNYKPQDASLRAKTPQPSVVDTVVISEDANHEKIVKVKTRAIRIPEIGDKFASRHGQKGTIGMIYRQEDMPCSIHGITPDMIINPHCIPSRMTIGHILETAMGKLVSLTADQKYSNGTSFDKVPINKYSKIFRQMGLAESGNQTMINPFNGRLMENSVFLGPIHYQRLRHMVIDKMYARNRGQVEAQTRQPLHGRTRGGGLRFGEMQKDCILSHGLSTVMRERLLKVSDDFHVFVCARCGLLALGSPMSQTYSCRLCKSLGVVRKVQMPYSCKQLIQELGAAHILVRMALKNESVT